MGRTNMTRINFIYIYYVVSPLNLMYPIMYSTLCMLNTLVQLEMSAQDKPIGPRRVESRLSRFQEKGATWPGRFGKAPTKFNFNDAEWFVHRYRCFYRGKQEPYM